MSDQTTLEQDIKKQDKREDARRDRFQAMFSEWLALRANDNDPSIPGDDDKDFSRDDRLTELARQITTTPAVLPWMIFEKLEVLEYYLAPDGQGTEWSDNREIVMLAGIKADIIRFASGRL